MKKFVSFILCVCVILSLLTTVSFAKTGDVIGYAKYTDISAYINHYPITSYNINDYTAVVAEDLQNYGFNVVWNDAQRSLSITRNESATKITPYGTVYKYSIKAGQNSFAYLETDIVTYVNGVKVESFNVDGKTCIYIDALAPCGEVVWIPETRAIKMWIDNMPIKEYAPIEEVPTTTMYATDGRTIIVELSEVESYKSVGWYSSQTEADAAKRAADPKYKDTIKILKKCKDDVDLAALEAATLPPMVSLYRLNPTKYSRYLVNMQTSINKIHERVSRVRNLTKDDRYIYPLHVCAEIDYVGVVSNGLSRVETYADRVGTLKAIFDSTCKDFGIEP